MKGIFKAILLVLAACFTVFTACDNGQPSEDNYGTPESGGVDASGVDWTNYYPTNNYSIQVRNNTAQDLVAFKQSPSASNLIGGIPAHANPFGLKKDPALFAATQGFPVVLLTRQQYEENKNNLAGLANTPFTRIYAFYNAAGTNGNVYEISGSLGGSCKLLIQNSTNMNVELRLNGVHGETL
jgi:hypothetical protein